MFIAVPIAAVSSTRLEKSLLQQAVIEWKVIDS